MGGARGERPRAGCGACHAEKMMLAVSVRKAWRLGGHPASWSMEGSRGRAEWAADLSVDEAEGKPSPTGLSGPARPPFPPRPPRPPPRPLRRVRAGAGRNCGSARRHHAPGAGGNSPPPPPPPPVASWGRGVRALPPLLLAPKVGPPTRALPAAAAAANRDGGFRRRVRCMLLSISPTFLNIQLRERGSRGPIW
jgi:hypothetical protein